MAQLISFIVMQQSIQALSSQLAMGALIYCFCFGISMRCYAFDDSVRLAAAAAAPAAAAAGCETKYCFCSCNQCPMLAAEHIECLAICLLINDNEACINLKTAGPVSQSYSIEIEFTRAY